MQPQAIKTRNRSQDEPMAEIESGETYSGIKFKGLNSWSFFCSQAESTLRPAAANAHRWVASWFR